MDGGLFGGGLFGGGLFVGGLFAGGLFPGRPFWSYPASKGLSRGGQPLKKLIFKMFQTTPCGYSKLVSQEA